MATKKRNRRKKCSRKRTRTRTRKGGASIAQIGKASAMRTWVTDEMRQQLNHIVHSGDRYPRDNPFKDPTTTYDEQLDRILNQAEHVYKENLASALKISRVNMANVAKKPSPPYRKATTKKLGPLHKRITAAKKTHSSPSKHSSS